VAQSTLVLQLSPSRAAAFKERVATEDFEFRPVAHASVSVKGQGVVATLYNSGKLVVQGSDPQSFIERFVENGAASVAGAPARPLEEDSAVDVPMVGSDESGKGDYFGPLVVAAVRLEPADSRALRGGPVRDSKTLSDETCLRLGASLRGQFPHAIASLDPPEYNRRHTELKNLNPLLGSLHAQVIRELALPGMLVLVDQFANARVMQSALAGVDVRLTQHPRAERIPSVAAASVIARERFLVELRELSERFAVDLCKGAGEPTDRAAREFVALHGIERLSQVAKLHFKNTQKLARLA
jgi:ribonuclease HIII